MWRSLIVLFYEIVAMTFSTCPFSSWLFLIIALDYYSSDSKYKWYFSSHADLIYSISSSSSSVLSSTLQFTPPPPCIMYCSALLCSALLCSALVTRCIALILLAAATTIISSCSLSRHYPYVPQCTPGSSHYHREREDNTTRTCAHSSSRRYM